MGKEIQLSEATGRYQYLQQCADLLRTMGVSPQFTEPVKIDIFDVTSVKFAVTIDNNSGEGELGGSDGDNLYISFSWLRNGARHWRMNSDDGIRTYGMRNGVYTLYMHDNSWMLEVPTKGVYSRYTAVRKNRDGTITIGVETGLSGGAGRSGIEWDYNSRLDPLVQLQPYIAKISPQLQKVGDPVDGMMLRVRNGLLDPWWKHLYDAIERVGKDFSADYFKPKT